MATYEFIATERTRAGVQPVLLDIREHDDHADKQFRRCWDKMHTALKGFHECMETECPSWAQWNILGWIKQREGLEDRLKFAAWDGDALVGFMHLRPNVVLSGRAPVLYVEAMASAPGSRSTEIWGSTGLSHVGGALLAFAIDHGRGKSLGTGLGLHADTADIEGFYEKMEIGGQRVFANGVSDIPGPPPQADKMKQRPYFETISQGAEALLESYRSG